MADLKETEGGFLLLLLQSSGWKATGRNYGKISTTGNFFL
jgi:hypothetical protein